MQKLYLPIFCFLICSVTAISVASASESNSSKYKPMLGLTAKGWTNRALARVGAVIPLYQRDNYLIFASLIGMFNDSKHGEGNFGIGFRSKINNRVAVGTYVFYDYRNTDYNFHQITPGVEVFSEKLEIRGNAYIPVGQKRHVTDSIGNVSFQQNSVNEATLSLTASTAVTVAMYGFDAEIGGMIPRVPRLRLYGAYYNFTNSEFRAIRGGRIRGRFRIIDNLNLVAESSYDRVRNSINYVGLNYSISIGSKHKQSLTAVEEMMTWLPTRDVDIVTEEDETFADIEIKAVQADITTLDLDGIVNAANKQLVPGGGVDGAIRNVAGAATVIGYLAPYTSKGGINTGDAIITPGGALKARNIIWTAGPIYQNGQDNKGLLTRAYKNSTELALEQNLKSLAFPFISSGGFGYPKDEASTVAIDTIYSTLVNNKRSFKAVFAFYGPTGQQDYNLFVQKIKAKQ